MIHQQCQEAHRPHALLIVGTTASLHLWADARIVRLEAAVRKSGEVPSDGVIELLRSRRAHLSTSEDKQSRNGSTTSMGDKGEPCHREVAYERTCPCFGTSLQPCCCCPVGGGQQDEQEQQHQRKEITHLVVDAVDPFHIRTEARRAAEVQGQVDSQPAVLR